MDKKLLKKMLYEQIEPLDEAAQRKLAYLQSDDVFTESTQNYAPRSVAKSDPSDSFADAFSETMSYEETYEAPEEIAEVGNGNDSGVSAPSRHQQLADKIAALRGISPADYMRKI